MKTSALRSLLAVLAVGLTGCVDISIGGRRSPPPPSVVFTPPAVLGTADAATVAEIDAAARLGLHSARSHALSEIARRPALSPMAQVHLVNVSYRCLSFDSGKLTVLRAVIANPVFSDVTRQAIAAQINHLDFDSSRQVILTELNKRATAH